MSYSEDISNLSNNKSDLFIDSQPLYSQKAANLSKECIQSDENYFEIGQREFRKIPLKKISFKIKKNPSLCRRNVEVQKKNCGKLSHVAQLTQKFNNMVTESDTINKPITLSQIDARYEYKKPVTNEIIITNQILPSNIKTNSKVFRKPSIKTTSTSDKTLVIIKTKSRENSFKNQNTLKSNQSASEDSKKYSNQKTPPYLVDNISDEMIQNNNNNNIVRAAIDIFEKRSSLNENIIKEKSDVKLGIRREQYTLKISKYIDALKQTEDTESKCNLNTKHNDSTIEMKKDSNKTEETNTSNIQVVDTKNGDIFVEELKLHISSQRYSDYMYETVDASNIFCSFRSKSDETIVKSDLPIRPNNSFLWRDKSVTNILRKSTDRNTIGEINIDQIPPKLPPKPGIISNKSDMCNDSAYEQINSNYKSATDQPSAEENIYEVMSSTQYKRPETSKASDTLLNKLEIVSDTEKVTSNCYETIYEKDIKKNMYSEGIYESVYESATVSCSNRDSLISSEQNSNSLYGKTLWESEDDNSTYKAVSDISDEWVDITDTEDSQHKSSGVIIICEKQRSKKSSWTQNLREQRAKTYSASSVTLDNDPDHHYESLYTTGEQDVDYDSFESDSEQSFKSDEKYNEKNGELPKPPSSQPYGIIKFAGKHMKKLKRRSIDLSKSLSRMTKRMSRTEPDDVTISPKNDECRTPESVKQQTSSNSFIPKNTAIYQNIDYTKTLTQKSPGDQERERISFLKRIRRSMSMSTENAVELRSNLMNKPRSTFYVTETIDIDKNENDATLFGDTTGSSRLSKLSVIRPKSPPPPAPIKKIDQKEVCDEVYPYIKPDEIIRYINDADSERKSNTCWYTEIGLYYSPDTTPGTSTSENSGCSATSNISNTNHESENYYNMKNKSQDSKSDSEYDEEKSKLDNLTHDIHDIQTLLQDEPLYQFYDAAVLESVCQDGIFQFDSDNYEEVDDETFSIVSSNSRPSAMDLVIPNKSTTFTKTLWCEIPEVIQSSVLSKLSVRQKKLQEAKFEIITSEASYVNSLNVLNNHFALNIKKCDCINEKEWDVIFGKVASVKVSSDRLLQDLEKCWQENILLYGICDIIQKHAEENFNVYIPYCENQIFLGDTLKQIMERPSFSSYLKELESSTSCQFLTLYSFLMLPMQRITRWPLLVDAVLKRLSQTDPEYIVCQHALATLNKIVNQCNEAARKKERELELKTIASKLEFNKGVMPINVISSNRWLVRSGVVTSIQTKSEDSKMTFGKRFNKIQLYLYLFNDLFFVTKEKSNGIYTILHYCPRNLVELRDTDVSFLTLKKDGNEKNLLFLTILENQEGKIVEYMLSCNKESDKERWIEAISPPKSEDPEETLYECWDCPQVTVVHNYNALQPDELSLARGDIINVLRKMADGWYHGERIRDGQTGWFPANYTSEIVNPHVKARNLKQRYRLLAFSENYLKSS